MKIEYTEGCTNYSLTIDGIETVSMEIEKVKDAIKTLLDNVEDLGSLQQVLISLIETKGDYEYLGTCEECGDSITKYTVNI